MEAQDCHTAFTPRPGTAVMLGWDPAQKNPTQQKWRSVLLSWERARSIALQTGSGGRILLTRGRSGAGPGSGPRAVGRPQRLWPWLRGAPRAGLASEMGALRRVRRVASAGGEGDANPDPGIAVRGWGWLCISD